jgi:hypothetical protein
MKGYSLNGKVVIGIGLIMIAAAASTILYCYIMLWQLCHVPDANQNFKKEKLMRLCCQPHSK